MPRFAANLGYLFADRKLIERVGAAAASGFKAIELQFPYDVPAAQMKAEIARHRLTVLGVNTPPGTREGEFGLAAMPGREKEWDVLFARALDYISAIGGTAIHCLAGRMPAEERAEAERTFVANLKRAADLAAEKNIRLLVEPINPRDRPNYFLNRVDHAADIVAKVGKPNIAIQFDFYHVQIVHGDPLRWFADYFPLIGHLQCAQVPDRHEPDSAGEVDFAPLFAAVDSSGYDGWIGAEYRPAGKTEDGLGWGVKYGLKATR